VPSLRDMLMQRAGVKAPLPVNPLFQSNRGAQLAPHGVGVGARSASHGLPGLPTLPKLGGAAPMPMKKKRGY
jgi:hypothetical protein